MNTKVTFQFSGFVEIDISEGEPTALEVHQEIQRVIADRLPWAVKYVDVTNEGTYRDER